MSGTAERALPRSAAYVDLDGTLCARSAETLFARRLLARRLIGPAEMARVAWGYLLYELRLIPDVAALKTRTVGGLLAGRPVAALAQAYASVFEADLLPAVRPALAAALEGHRAAGRDLVLVSSAIDVAVRPFAERFGFVRWYATRLDTADGHYTGRIEGAIPFGPEKAAVLAADATRHGVDLGASYAYGDHAADRFMLECVGHPVAVAPDRALRREAAARGWPVLALT